MENVAAELTAKGWSRAEAKKAADIMAHAQAEKSQSMIFLEQTVFWVGMAVAMVGNFIVSVVLVPFLLLLTGWGLYAAVFVIGAAFGLLFNVLIQYIEELGEGQHIIAGAFIPALALVNVYIIAHFSNRLEILLQLENPAHSPLLISITYVVAFVLPYLIEHLQHIRKKQL